jgi:hypothetical protein
MTTRIDGNLPRWPAAIYSSSSSCPAAAPPCLGDGEFPGEVREVERDKWPAPESTRDPEGLYMVVVSSVYGGFRRKRLGGVGGCAGRHRALSAGSRVGASVAGCFM